MVSRAELEALMHGRLDTLRANGPSPDGAIRRLIFPGAFNPLHDGHRQMAAVAARLLNAPTEFELSIQNVDKPTVEAAQILTRLTQFDRNDVVWLTNADTFVKKARVFPAATFVVGVDTIQRVADVGYYQGSQADRDEAIGKLREQACRFLVFGRKQAEMFRQLQDCELPSRLLEICDDVPEAAFRLDISSKELRRSEGSTDRPR